MFFAIFKARTLRAMPIKKTSARPTKKTTTKTRKDGTSGRQHVGTWIDGNEAVIIRPGGEKPMVLSVKSDREEHKAAKDLKHVGVRSGIRFINQEKKELDRIQNQRKSYLDKVIAELKGAERLILFGPARMKQELENRIAKDLPDVVCERMTTGPMTRNQKVAWVKRYFAGAVTK